MGNYNTKPRAKNAHLSHLPEYTNWANMCYRCTYPKNPRYQHYGGRGIKVCDRWREKEGFKNFLDDMGHKPTAQHSIDRINVNGNYEPSNCRWATPLQQAITRRISKRNTSGYLGVTLHRETGKWRARARGISLGLFSDPVDAAIAYDQTVLSLKGSLATTNFL